MASKEIQRHPNGQPVGNCATGRPLEGIVDWEIDYAKYTEYALLQRDYVPRPGRGAWLTGYYHFNRRGIGYGGWSTEKLDEDGFNEVCWVPIGEQDVNRWAETNWKRNFTGLYAWYSDADEQRPYFHNAILFIKSDVYVHTAGTIDDVYGNSGGERSKK